MSQVSKQDYALFDYEIQLVSLKLLFYIACRV